MIFRWQSLVYWKYLSIENMRSVANQEWTRSRCCFPKHKKSEIMMRQCKQATNCVCPSRWIDTDFESVSRFFFSWENILCGNFKMSKIKITKNVCKVLYNKLSRFLVFLWIFLGMRFFVCPLTIFLLFTSFDLGVVPQKAKPPHFLNIWLRLDNGALCLRWESSLCSHWLIWQAIVD